MVNNQRQYDSSVSRQIRVTSGMWLKLTSLLFVVKVCSAESQMEPSSLLPISAKYSNTPIIAMIVN